MHVTKKHRKGRIDSKHGQMLNRANIKHCSCNGVLFQVCKCFLKFTKYKLIIASQGRGECKVDHFLKAKHKGKRLTRALAKTRRWEDHPECSGLLGLTEKVRPSE